VVYGGLEGFGGFFCFGGVVLRGVFCSGSDVHGVMLGLWEEAVGVLVGVEPGVAVFEGFRVLLPGGVEASRLLEGFVGCRVGVLRTDCPGKQLVVRLLDGDAGDDGGLSHGTVEGFVGAVSDGLVEASSLGCVKAGKHRLGAAALYSAKADSLNPGSLEGVTADREEDAE